MNILLVEDNPDLASNMFEYFESRRHTMDLARDGMHGLHLVSRNPYIYDVLVLDRMLPRMDGITLCKQLRDAEKHMPILMLTARDSLEDKIEGLEAGADDYVIKPFFMREIEARLFALVRRAQVRKSTGLLQVGDLSFNTATLKVLRNERTIVLPPIALKLLELLMRHSPRVLSREEIEHHLWRQFPPDGGALRTHLHILRNAVDQKNDRPLIKTLRGIGYQIDDK
jgi:DNA-binding response OmpR family regulator